MKRNILLFSLCLVFALSQISFAYSSDWQEVTQAELSMTKGKVDPNADAEVIFWEVRVNDSSQDIREDHYVRVKIFTERGREKYSKVDLPYVKKRMKIDDIMARVIKKDGSIVEISKDDIFEKEISKSDGFKIKAKSFAVPNIEPGVILEYKYRETVRNSGVGAMPLYFQHDVPIQRIKYYVKPYSGRYGMRYLVFNNQEKFVKDKKGFFSASMENVPALKDEPFMPPEEQVRAWMLIYYDFARAKTPNDYWADYAARRKNWHKSLKPSKDVKAILPQIISDSKTADEKLSKIFRFCKNEIKNINYDVSLSREEREDIAEDVNSARDALKEKRGSSIDINRLFGALAAAAGYEVRFAFSGNRNKFFFSPRYPHSRFVHRSFIAVKADGDWKFFDPGSRFTPEGMIPWHDEAVDAMLLGKKDFVWVRPKIAGPEKSLKKRTGKFKLLPDGTLEGAVKIQYTGHVASYHKILNFDESANKQEERLKSRVKRTMSTAELSDITVKNADDPEKPFIYEYKMRVPNYATKTGKRLFLQPGVFEFGSKPVFSTATRKHQIYFKYPWSEQDEITIELPKDFSLDNADAPERLADRSNIGVLDINILHDKSTNTLIYKRKFHFGGNGMILFPAAAYPSIKTLFDAFNKADTHMLSLKKVVAQ